MQILDWSLPVIRISLEIGLSSRLTQFSILIVSYTMSLYEM